MTREAETVEKMRAAYFNTQRDSMSAALSVIRAIVFEEVEKDIPDGVMPLSGCRCVRSRTAAEIKAALIERLGEGK